MKKMMVTWEINRPVLSAHEIVGDLVAFVPWLQKQTILLPITPAAAFTCTECGERQRLQYLPDQQGKAHAFIHCRECGPAAVDDSLLQRWEINSCRFLGTIFQPFQLSTREYVPRQLWQIGSANVAGRSGDLWFVRTFQRSLVDSVLATLKTRPKSILFTPLESTAVRWQQLLPNLVLSLEQTISQPGIIIDVEAIARRIADLEPPTKTQKTLKVSAKRATRLAQIELLCNELKKHVRSARDHAFVKKEITGKAMLLKRPTKKKLGELVGLRSDTVTHCFQDKAAGQLRGLWKLAVNLPRIMDWNGTNSKGEK